MSDLVRTLGLFLRQRRRLPGARFERGDLATYRDTGRQVRVLSVQFHESESVFVYRVRFTEPPRVRLWQLESDLRR